MLYLMMMVMTTKKKLGTFPYYGTINKQTIFCEYNIGMPGTGGVEDDSFVYNL